MWLFRCLGMEWEGRENAWVTVTYFCCCYSLYQCISQGSPEKQNMLVEYTIGSVSLENSDFIYTYTYIYIYTYVCVCVCMISQGKSSASIITWIIRELAWSANCKLENQESQLCNSAWIQSSENQKNWCQSTGEDGCPSSAESKLTLHLPFCSSYTLNMLDNAHPHWWGQVALLKCQSVPDTSVDTPGNNVLRAISGYPLAQSRWHKIKHHNWLDGNSANENKDYGGEILILRKSW